MQPPQPLRSASQTLPRLTLIRPTFNSIPQWGCPHRAPLRHHRWVCDATRDVEFAYQKDIQTKLKPGVFAERQDSSKTGLLLAAATDWQTVVKLFHELGADTDRNVGLVGEMLVALQRLAPPAAAAAAAGSAARLAPADARLLASGTAGMADALLNNLGRVGNRQLVNAVWALALLPDPSKTLATPAAAAARARAVAGFGAAVLNRLRKLQAEEMFHVFAGLALLGFRPPRTLTRDDDEQQAAAGGGAISSSSDGAQPGAAAAPARSPQGPVKFGSLLERRSLPVMHYVSPKGLADAAFVVGRLVPAGDMSSEWLDAYATATKQHLPSMQPEALVYAGYALARHGFRTSNSWQKAFIRALQPHAASLAGEEFPLALFTLAKWAQQRERQQATQQQPSEEGLVQAQDDYEEDDFADADGLGLARSSSSSSSSWDGGAAAGEAAAGTAVPQDLLDTLLLASHTNRALRELPLAQVAVMVNSLAQLQLPVNPLWQQRLWPAVIAKIDAVATPPASPAAGAPSGSPAAAAAAAPAALVGDLAVLLGAIPRLTPQPSLPPDFLDVLVGNLGLGLQQLAPQQLAGVWAALQQLRHSPDAIFQRQMQQAALAAAGRARPRELPALVQLGLALAMAEPATQGNSSSSSGAQGRLAAGDFLQQFVAALQQNVDVMVQAAAQQQQQQQQQQQGVWSLADTLLSCLRAVAAAAAAAAAPKQPPGGDVADVLQQVAVPALRDLWRRAVVGVAAVLPADPLLVLMGSVLDASPEDQQLLGLDSSGKTPVTQLQQQQQLDSRAAVIEAILQAGVYPRIATSSAGGSSRGRRGAAAAAAAADSFAAQWSVADCAELLVVLADAGLPAAPTLLDAMADALRCATAGKAPLAGPQGCSFEDADELVRALTDDFGYELPAKARASYRKWRWPGGAPPEARKRPRKKAATAASKAAVGNGDGSDGRAAAGEGFVAAEPAAMAPAAAAEAGPELPPPPPPPPRVPAVAPDASGLVRSSRSRPTSRTASL